MAQPRLPGLQLFHQVFPEKQIAETSGLSALETYLEDGGSIFPLVESGVQGLLREYKVSPEDARRYLRRANSLATYLRRRYIEQELSGSQEQSTRVPMVDGPRFETLINPGFDRMCPVDALESLASPVAYLLDLLRWLFFRIEPCRSAEAAKKYAIDLRRTDVKKQQIDFNAVFQSLSSVDIIVKALEAFIMAQLNLSEDKIEDAMIVARYPNGLPYYQHWVTVDGITGLKNCSVGDFAQAIDLAYPYFLRAEVRETHFDRALAHASRLGPYQRKLLTEPGPVFGNDPEIVNKFCQENFGTTALQVPNLPQVNFFADRTKLDTTAIERLLSIRAFSTVRSPNAPLLPWLAEKSQSGLSGSFYINADADKPIDIIEGDSDNPFMHRLSVIIRSEQGLDAFDRMNRMIRLCNWLELPSEQVDALLAAAIRADVRGGETSRRWITDNVVHALGLFRMLRNRYSCSAADFAVFIDELSIYGRGETLSQFDQLFNSRAAYAIPLQLDGKDFPVTPLPGQPDLTIERLREGLSIDPQTYEYLAVTVARAHGTGAMLTRSLPVISSFYRLVHLPRLLGITPVEGVLMLAMFGGDAWLSGMAGTPVIHASDKVAPDVLNIIGAMQTCVQWCGDNKLDVTWMLQHVAASQPASQLSEPDRQFFDQIRRLLPTALLTHATVMMAGVPAAGASDWLHFLAKEVNGVPNVVDADGLVLTSVLTTPAYQDEARKRIEWAVDNALGSMEEDLRAAIINALLKVLLDARDAQVSLVKETLAVYAGVGVDLAIPVLNWAQSTVYDLLRQVCDLVEPEDEPSQRRRPAHSEKDARRLPEIRRLAEVTAALGISAAALQAFLDYGREAWLERPDEEEFSVHTLYGLMTLTQVIGASAQAEQEVLDYLRDAHELPAGLGGHAKLLAQEVSAIRVAAICGWSVQEVRECLRQLSPDLPVLKNLTQLDALMRVRKLSLVTGMDARTIFEIGNLPEVVDANNRPAYAGAAELALLSASTARVPQVQAAADLKQLVTIESTVDPTTVVAGSGQTAVYTVTVKDAEGEALSGVRVNFRASLGTLPASDYTDTNGSVKVTYIPGKTMGRDTPIYWLDLFEPENATPIDLISDHESLHFVLGSRSPSPSGLIPVGQEIELYAKLGDNYNNIGVDEIVHWGHRQANKRTVVSIRPNQVRTDKEGLARVFVSSDSAAEIIVSAICDRSGKMIEFDPITFANDQPSE
ncbi:Virulence plasmid 28 protein [Pseudomonas sp. IT-347P]|uniref:Tc toxin subunit A n=1 Tax=Pseudomonas sp. IT-347P TaxID=3026458 RepID=UPI0039E035C3